ncbi:MAG: hypothetical protein JW889_11635 [Verrucomicrobia bacterium]|nr:hypothetical protein [Verrucomicrobiota bacterium]
MKKLALIAVMLLVLPAAASAVDLINDDFESYAAGSSIAWQWGPGGNWMWGGSGVPYVVADPTGTGSGQVLAFKAGLSTEEGVFCDQHTTPTPLMIDPGMTATLSVDYFIKSEGMLGRTEWGPIADYYFDGLGIQNPGTSTINAYMSGPQWAALDPGLVVAPVAPLPINVWFNVTEVFDGTTGLNDIYVNGSLVASGLPQIWYEANYMEFHYWCFDEALDGIDGMYIDNAVMSYEVIPEPGMIALGAFGLLALLRRKK